MEKKQCDVCRLYGNPDDFTLVRGAGICKNCVAEIAAALWKKFFAAKKSALAGEGGGDGPKDRG